MSSERRCDMCDGPAKEKKSPHYDSEWYTIKQKLVWKVWFFTTNPFTGSRELDICPPCMAELFRQVKKALTQSGKEVPKPMK